MNGKLNYGLLQNNINAQCECYIFDNLNDTSDPVYKLETLDMNNDITDMTKWRNYIKIYRRWCKCYRNLLRY